MYFPNIARIFFPLSIFFQSTIFSKDFFLSLCAVSHRSAYSSKQNRILHEMLLLKAAKLGLPIVSQIQAVFCMLQLPTVFCCGQRESGPLWFHSWGLAGAHRCVTESCLFKPRLSLWGYELVTTGGVTSLTAGSLTLQFHKVRPARLFQMRYLRSPGPSSIKPYKQ